MVRPMPEYFSGGYMRHQSSLAPLLTAVGLFVTITTLVALCANHNSRGGSSKSTKGTSTTSKKNQQLKGEEDFFQSYTHHETKLNNKENHTIKAAVIPVSSKDTVVVKDNDQPPQLSLVVPPRSPLRTVLTSPLRSPLMKSPKKLFTAINDKAISPFIRRGKKRSSGGGNGIHDHDLFTSDEEEVELDMDFGLDDDEEEGVWQKNILLGDKCRPLEFSGVIYYDSSGNKVDDIPRSPRRATPPSSPYHRGFSFPVPSSSIM